MHILIKWVWSKILAQACAPFLSSTSLLEHSVSAPAALMLAAEGGHSETVKGLITAGENVNMIP